MVTTTEGGPAAWRASLEDSRTGKRLGFASLEQLFVHLMESIDDADLAGSAPANAPPAVD